MDLSIILWTFGMLFTLSIFAVKVGFGLGFGGMRWKGIFLTLFLYLLLFGIIAMLSEHLIKILEPILRKGPYLHAVMAMAMIVWGMILLRNSDCSHQKPTTHIPHSALLLIPCPVCLTAMTFSTWAALSVIKLPAHLVGLGLGIVFCLLSLLFCCILKFIARNSSPRIGISLGMIVIGLYFLASLIIPAKIEEAKGIYRSFLTGANNIDLNNSIGVFALLFSAMLIGFFAKRTGRKLKIMVTIQLYKCVR